MDSGGGLLSGVKQPGGPAKGKMIQAAGGGGPRKRLSDITNISTLRSSPSPFRRGRPSASFLSNPDCITQLLQENNSLIRIVAERNEEVKKFRISLKKLTEQNWNLAKAHSQLLGELNSGKDKLKVLHHELGCAAVSIKFKMQEIEEKNKLIEKLTQKANAVESALRSKRRNVAKGLTCDDSSVKTCHPRKQTWRSQSLAPVAVTVKASAKKDKNRRKSMIRGSCIVKSESTVKSETIDPAEDLFEMVDIQLPTSVIDGLPMRGDDSTSSNSSAASGSSLSKLGKTEVKEEEFRMTSTGRLSIGRPLRKATEKVASYKEVPLNIKMRRNF